MRDGYLVTSPASVAIERRQVGILGYDTFLRVELPPGTHDVRAQDFDTRQQLAVTIVRPAAGEIRYVVLANALFDAPLARSVTEITAREMTSSEGRAAVLSKARAAVAEFDS